MPREALRPKSYCNKIPDGSNSVGNFIFIKKYLAQSKFFVFLHRVSLIRPAPVKLPQGRKAARVDG